MYTKTVYFISQIYTLKMGFRTVYFITPVYFISPPPSSVARVCSTKFFLFFFFLFDKLFSPVAIWFFSSFVAVICWQSPKNPL